MPCITITTKARRRWPRRVLVAFAVLVGVAITSHPVGATVLTDHRLAQHALEVDREVVSRPGVDEQFAAARAYNRTLDPTALDDPWTARGAAGSAEYDDYLHPLGGSSPMGSIDVPAIGVHLPIVRDTSAESLHAAVGHFFGTSLPVGGAGSHAVLAGHSGSQGSLFDRLPEVEVGDEFHLRVYGRTLSYRVDRVVEVLPGDLERIRPQRGRDLVTLVTCTPRGVNTHRLLVRGVRIDSPTAEPAPIRAAAGFDLTVQDWMMPRMMVAAVALGVLVFLILGWLVSDRRARRRVAL